MHRPIQSTVWWNKTTWSSAEAHLFVPFVCFVGHLGLDILSY